MARKLYKKSIQNLQRNRGEDRGPEIEPGEGYQYSPPMTDKTAERSIRRHEMRDIYGNIYRDNQERDQRAFSRIRDMKSEFYAGLDPRRRQEVAEGGMVQEDHRAIANLPEQPLHYEYPQDPYYNTPYLDSLLRGNDPELDDYEFPKTRYRINR